LIKDLSAPLRFVPVIPPVKGKITKKQIQKDLQWDEDYEEYLSGI
jgi:hypothetical protein